MAYGSRNTRSASFSSDGVVELVALELDEQIELSCSCGQCEKERKIWLDFPSDFQFASEFMTRITERYHLNSGIRLFFLGFYMAPTTPIFIMRVARGILKVMPARDVDEMGGSNITRGAPNILQDQVSSDSFATNTMLVLRCIEIFGPVFYQLNVTDIEGGNPRGINENIPSAMTDQELSPVIGPRRIRTRAPTPYYPNTLHSLHVNLPKKTYRRRRTLATTTLGAKISNNTPAQQHDRKKGTKRLLQSDVAPRAKKSFSYFASSSDTPDDENEDPNWSPDLDSVS